METLFNDLRYAIRLLVKNPAFTVVAVLALAIGIGANTAIFSVVNAVLVRPLPYKDPEKLVMVWEHNRTRGRNRNVVSPANFMDWRDQNGVFEQMGALFEYRFNLTGVDEPEELPAHAVTTNFFSLLGVNALAGRTFLPEESEPGKDNVVILSYGLWQRRFGSDVDLIGKNISLSGESCTVVGVMPPDFKLNIRYGTGVSKPPELWAPMTLTVEHRNRGGRYMAVIGRLKPGVTVAQAQSDMNNIGARLEEQFKERNTGWGVNIVPLKEQMVGEIRPALLVLLAAVAFVLLIACANVANLLLARASSRQREIAIRAAMGASRFRIVRQLLTESALLALLGGSIGLLLALWGVELLLALTPRELLQLNSIELDYRVLGFTLAISLLTGLIFGLAPALVTSRLNLNESLKEGGKGTAGAGRSHRFRNIFIVAEVALALILLIGSGLMIQSFLRLQSVNPGFDPDNLLTFKLLLPNSKYGKEHQRVAFFQELLGRIEKVPGVKSAGAISFLPFSGLGAATGFTIAGQPAPEAGKKPVADVRVIDPSYFKAMGISFIQGRNFSEREAKEVSRVVVINETMARQYFPNEDPIGKKVTIEMKDVDVPSEIIGVVRDIKYAGLDVEPRAMSYWPHPELAYSFMTVVIRSESDPSSLASAIQSEVRGMDRDQPIADIYTMNQILSESVARSRFSAMLLAIFASVALILAAVGIYGVMAYSVTERTHEIGLRMALGAQQRDILKLVLGRGMLLTGIGVAIGLMASFALTRIISSLLFNVSATDPLTFAGLSILLSGVALLACYIPARRATKVDPMVALRYE